MADKDSPKIPLKTTKGPGDVFLRSRAAHADELVSPEDERHAEVVRELVAHLREKRTELREEWARRIMGARFLTAMTDEEILAECSAVYDNYLGTLETMRSIRPLTALLG